MSSLIGRMIFLVFVTITLGLTIPTLTHAIDLSNEITTAVGIPASQTLFPTGAQSWTYCPDTENVPCTSAPAGQLSCLTKDQISTALASNTKARDALMERFDLELTIETEPSDSSQFVGSVMKVLFNEVLGFSVRHVYNPKFSVQLQRCLDGKFDFHPEIWRTDYNDQQWADAFYTKEQSSQVCNIVGVSGVLVQNSWYADAASVNAFANSTQPGDQPFALDFWRAYTTVAAVQGLVRFDAAVADADTVNTWFVPPICRQVGEICGVAHVESYDFEPGVPQQQVMNLGWRIAIMFPANFAMFDIVAGLVGQGKQVLFMLGVLDTFIATESMVRVLLPPVKESCFDGKVHLNGTGPYRCDFREQTLLKLAKANSDSDLQDAWTLFQRLTYSREEVVAVMEDVYLGMTVPDAACLWVRKNPSVWSNWITVTTRKHEVFVSESGTSTVYAISAIFLLFSLLSHIFLFLNRAHPVIRRSSHTFAHTIVLGASIFYITLLIGIQKDSVATCIVSQFLFSIGFSLFYASFLVKTYRLYLIFNSQQLTPMKLPDSKMLLYLGAYASLDILIVILWSGISPPEPRLIHASAEYELMTECSSENSVVFRTILYVIRGLALFTGAILAVRIRGLEEEYNESKSLAAISYNILILSAIVLGISLVGGRSPSIAVGSWAVGVALAVFCSLLMFILPKAIDIHTISSSAVTYLTHTKGAGATQTSTIGTGSDNAKTFTHTKSPTHGPTSPMNGGRNLFSNSSEQVTVHRLPGRNSSILVESSLPPQPSSHLHVTEQQNGGGPSSGLNEQPDMSSQREGQTNNGGMIPSNPDQQPAPSPSPPTSAM